LQVEEIGQRRRKPNVLNSSLFWKQSVCEELPLLCRCH
jgi:hypothetical protein